MIEYSETVVSFKIVHSPTESNYLQVENIISIEAVLTWAQESRIYVSEYEPVIDLGEGRNSSKRP